MKFYDDERIEYGKTKITTDMGVMDFDLMNISGYGTMQFGAGATGFSEKDSGDDARASIQIKDLGMSDIRIKDLTKYTDYCRGNIIITMAGDAEVKSLIDGLRWMADTLESKITKSE